MTAAAAPPHDPAGPHPTARGFWIGVGLAGLSSLLSVSLEARAAALWLVLSPLRLLGAVLPGSSPAADAGFIGLHVLWLGAAGALVAALAPLGLLIAAAVRLRGPARGLARLTETFARAVEAVSRKVGDGVGWTGLALVIVVGVIVTQRYVFGLAYTKLQDAVLYLHAVLFLFSAAAALLDDGHVRVDIFYGKLAARGRALVDLAGALFLAAPTLLLVIATSRGYVARAWAVLEGSAEADGLALVYLLKTAIPLFAALLLAQVLAVAGRAALTLTADARARREGSR